MSALAAYLKDQGFRVFGSDRAYNVNCEKLALKGVKVYKTHSEKNLKDVDVVIVNSAINDDNVELAYAKKNKLPIFTRAELLKLISDRFRTTIGIAGSHGKTTMTSLVSHILYLSDKKFTSFIGGNDKKLGNYFNRGEEILVSEVCEFKKNIDYFSPSIGVVLNVDNDHLDSYDGLDQLKSAFLSYLDRSVCPVVNADDKTLSSYPKSVTFAITDKSAEYVSKESFFGKTASFPLLKNGKTFLRIKSKLEGKHNVYNILAAVAVSDTLGINKRIIKRAVASFDGVKRRNEFLGTINGAKCYGDYAHHPREIEAYINALNVKNSNRVYFVFQPHTYSRTRILFNEFVVVLSRLKNLYLYRTYSAREEVDEKYSAKALAKAVSGSEYYDSFDELMNNLKKRVKKGDKVCFVGAGDVYDLAVEQIEKGL